MYALACKGSNPQEVCYILQGHCRILLHRGALCCTGAVLQAARWTIPFTKYQTCQLIKTDTQIIKIYQHIYIYYNLLKLYTGIGDIVAHGQGAYGPRCFNGPPAQGPTAHASTVRTLHAPRPTAPRSAWARWHVDAGRRMKGTKVYEELFLRLAL